MCRVICLQKLAKFYITVYCGTTHHTNMFDLRKQISVDTADENGLTHIHKPKQTPK